MNYKALLYYNAKDLDAYSKTFFEGFCRDLNIPDNIREEMRVQFVAGLLRHPAYKGNDPKYAGTSDLSEDV